MNNEKFFGIIIPFKSVNLQLYKCLESIINQTYKNYKIILVSGEKDAKKILDLKEYLKNVSFVFIEQEKLEDNVVKIANARNMGVNCVKEKYFMFCDSDDLLHKKLLEKLHNYLKKYKNVDVLKFGGYRIKNNKIFALYKSKNQKPQLPSKNLMYYVKKGIRYGPLWLYAYNTKFWKENGFQFLENHQYEDIYNNYVLAAAKNFASISFKGYYYISYNNSLTNLNPKDKQMRRANSILANYDNVFNLLTSNNNNKKFLNKYLPAVFFVLEYNYKRFQDDVLVYYKHEVKKREKLLKDFINNGV